MIEEDDKALAVLPPNAPLALRQLAEDNLRDVEGSTSRNTRRAYKSDWRSFEAWCASNGLMALPALPAAVATYLTHLANDGKKASTIMRALTTISQAHKALDLPNPRSSLHVKKTLEGVIRRVGIAQKGKSPLLAEALRLIVAGIPDTFMGARDRALLTLGFAGAFRRSELVALNVADLSFQEEGLVITIRRSKTDQHGAGRLVAVPRSTFVTACPVHSTQTWLQIADAIEGPVFCAMDHAHYGERLSDASVAETVKKYVKRAGLDPTNYAGHSLRAGFATTAAKAGKTERSIMKQTGHKSSAMLARYIREVGLFEDNAAEGLL